MAGIVRRAIVASAVLAASTLTSVPAAAAATPQAVFLYTKTGENGGWTSATESGPLLPMYQSAAPYRFIREADMRPDGAFIVVGDGYDVAIEYADGSCPTYVPSQNWEESPSLDPTGRFLSFHAWDIQAHTYVPRTIDIMDLRTSTVREIGPGGQGSWSPDGNELVYPGASEDGTASLRRVRSDGSNNTSLNVAGGAPAWSPTGSSIAFLQQQDSTSFGVALTDRDGSKPRLLTGSAVRDATSPIVWSPDGNTIYFHRRTPGVWRIQADGSGLTQVRSDDVTLRRVATRSAAPPQRYRTVTTSGEVREFGGRCGATGSIRQLQALGAPPVAIATAVDGRGSWVAASNGAVGGLGNVPVPGSLIDTRLARPIVGIAGTPTAGGYWMVASDGGIFSFGDATFYGSTGAIRLNKPIVGMTSTPSGWGYWLVASDGGIFSFGDATFFGSAPSSGPAVAGVAR